MVDDFNREALSIEIDLNLSAARVVRVLERTAAWRGYPAKIRMDDGPEFISASLPQAGGNNLRLEVALKVVAKDGKSKDLVSPLTTMALARLNVC